MGLTKQQHVVHQLLVGQGLYARHFQASSLWQVDLHAEVGLWRRRGVRHDRLYVPGAGVAAVAGCGLAVCWLKVPEGKSEE